MTKIFVRLVEVGGPELAKRMLQLHIERCGKALGKLDSALHQKEKDNAGTYLEYLEVCCEEVGMDNALTILNNMRGKLRVNDYTSPLNEMGELRESLSRQHTNIARSLEDLPL